MAAKLSEKHGVKIQAYQCDVGDGDLTKAVFKTIESELGEITGLIAVSSFARAVFQRASKSCEAVEARQEQELTLLTLQNAGI